MTADTILAGNTVVPAGKGWFQNLPVMIVSGCLLFNFFLCFIHTSGINISEMHVILCELALVFLAAAYGFYRPDRNRYFWLIILMTQFVLLSLLSVIRDEFMIKALRDVMIMPVFISLGL